MKKNNRRRIFWIFSSLVVLLGVVLRLYRIDAPIADWHSWRQSDTAAVSRNFLRFGIDPLRPRYDDLSNIQSGKDNPMGYRMVEAPLYQLLAVFGKLLVPQFSIEVWLRLVSIFSSGASALFLIFLGYTYGGALAGILSGFIFSVLPYSIFYGRSVLPENLMVCLSLASIVCASRIHYMKGVSHTLLIIMSGVFAAGALLAKPMAAFLLLPLVPILWQSGSGWMLRSIAILLGSSIPVLLWRRWVQNFPEGIPASSWLFNEGGIRLKGAWFHWLFAQRIGKLMLGFWGLIPFGFGLAFKRSTREMVVYGSFLIGVLLYFIIIARGNVQHDYYQILVLPMLSLYVGKGLGVLIRPPREFSVFISRMLAFVSILFMFAFSWYEVRSYYWINRPEIVEAGTVADRLLPIDAKVIAPYNGDTTFLYQTGRPGWPIGFDIANKISLGATHYVTVSPSDRDFETKELAEKYTVLVRNERFAIIDLTELRVSP